MRLSSYMLIPRHFRQPSPLRTPVPISTVDGFTEGRQARRTWERREPRNAGLRHCIGERGLARWTVYHDSCGPRCRRRLAAASVAVRRVSSVFVLGLMATKATRSATTFSLQEECVRSKHTVEPDSGR